MSQADYYEQFWEASAYSPYNLAELAAQQEAFAGQSEQASVLEYPATPRVLPLPKRNPLTPIEDNRRSSRAFTGEPLSQKDFGLLLASFRATSSLEHRTYPSAGARYALEVFCIPLQVENYEPQLLYYNPDLHATSVIGPAPSWTELAPNINLNAAKPPQCLIIFASLPQRLTDKYGERGGRFALLECGAAMQQLALHIASTRHLIGCPIGGLVDEYWNTLLELQGDRAQIMLGYACGQTQKAKPWHLKKNPV